MPLITNVPPPSLPYGTEEYSRKYQDQFSNVLRLYFNQLFNLFATLFSETGGSYIRFPNGSFYQDGVTALTGAMTNVSTTPILVGDTSAFVLTSGALIIGTEIVKYTGKTATSFTGITRGAYGSTAAAHAIGVTVTEAQPVASATTAATIALSQTTVSNQVAIDSTDKTKIVFSVAGYYNIQFSVQLVNYSGTIDNVTFWFRQNGVDIPYTAGVGTVPAVHGGIAGTAIIAWNLVQSVNAGDYIQLLFSSDSGNTVCATYPAGTAPVHPVSPSVILTATFVSALY